MATELAKAYVQIIPSAKGIRSSLGDVLNNDAGSAGDDAGKITGSSLVSGIKKMIVAAGIGKALQSALTQGAALQQSLGGIETLFKDSAKKVVANADQAYRTSGMSANEYMETVAGFSASLLQGLAGNTNKAADVADMALTDMSDNANKMGTSMELIQNAYQGFAKQNYTMLDNLKLGYGGTKTEMERLLADAQKITGVKYDISNLSDVYSAIHVIQDEMGITGTTAKEASETLSGSFASMKAAAKDFIGNMALGKDVSVQLHSLLDTTTTFLFGNLIPMIGNVVASIGTVLVTTDWGQVAKETIGGLCLELEQKAREILGTDGSIVDAVLAAIEERLPFLLQEGSQIISSLVKGILEKIPQVIESAGVILSNFITFIMRNFPTVLEAGINLILNLVNGIIRSLPKIVTSAATVVAQLVATIAKNAPKLLESGISLLGKLAAGLIKAVPTLIAQIPSIISKIKKSFTSIDWASIGKNIILGIARGITNGVSSIISAAKTAAKNALKAAKKALDINSPSGAFEKEVGEQSDEGWALGIKNKASIVSSAVKKVSRDTLGLVGTEFSLTALNTGTNDNISSGNNITNFEGLLDGVVLELVNQISLDGRTLKEIVYRYVIETIDGQQKAVLATKGAF